MGRKPKAKQYSIVDANDLCHVGEDRVFNSESEEDAEKSLMDELQCPVADGGIGGNGGGSITTPITLQGTDQTRNYALDGLGNWKNTAYALVGSGGSTTATTEIRNHNDVNQITRINTNGTSQPEV